MTFLKSVFALLQTRICFFLYRKPKKMMRKLMPLGPPSRLEPILLRNRAVSGIAGDQLPLLSDGYSRKRWSPQDEDCDNEPVVKRIRISCPSRWVTDPNVDTPTPEDITDEMLDNVADNVMKDKVTKMYMDSQLLTGIVGYQSEKNVQEENAQKLKNLEKPNIRFQNIRS